MKYLIQAVIMLIALSNVKAGAQGIVKVGIGANYVSNTYPQPHLYDYFAPSFNLQYAFFRQDKFAMSVESATSFRNSQSQNAADQKFGFTSSLPLLANVSFGKTTLYAGAGPAYAKQVSKSYGHNERNSAYYLQYTIGAGFKGKTLIEDFLCPEYNIRVSYLNGRSTNSSNGAMLSFIIMLTKP